jgi:flagellar basal body-associated protein FliL
MAMPEQNNYLSTSKQVIMNNILTTLAILIASVITTLLSVLFYYTYVFFKYIKENESQKESNSSVQL